MEYFETIMEGMSLGKFSDEFAEWLDIDKSFQGWLLTLNENDLAELCSMVDEFAEGTHNHQDIGNLVILVGLKKIPRNGTIISNLDYKKFKSYMCAGSALISLYRKGFVESYKKADEDGDWEFTFSEEGLKIINEKYPDND